MMTCRHKDLIALALPEGRFAREGFALRNMHIVKLLLSKPQVPLDAWQHIRLHEITTGFA